jgi:hypothetical protein
MDGKQSLGILLMGFVLILIGVILTGVVADEVYKTRTPTDIVNESVTLVAAATSTGQNLTATLANDDVLTITYFGNATDSVTSTGTEVNVTDQTGVLLVSNASGGFFTDGNPYNVTYDYAGAQYIQGSATSRTIINLTTLFFTLGIMALGVLFVIKSGLLDMLKK